MFELYDDGQKQPKMVIEDISMGIYYTIYQLLRCSFIVIYFYLFPFLVVLYSLVFAYQEFEKMLDEGSTQYATAITGNLAQQLIDLVSQNYENSID